MVDYGEQQTVFNAVRGAVPMPAVGAEGMHVVAAA